MLGVLAIRPSMSKPSCFHCPLLPWPKSSVWTANTVVFVHRFTTGGLSASETPPLLLVLLVLLLLLLVVLVLLLVVVVLVEEVLPPPLPIVSPPPPQPTVTVVARARARKTRLIPTISSYSPRGEVHDHRGRTHVIRTGTCSRTAR